MLHAHPGSAATAAQPADDDQVAPLILVIVVDQLRADFPRRARQLAGPGGFARFHEHGVVYQNAQYEHAFTLTAPGHATVFTGAHPSEHGIVANEWYDRTERRRVESVADAEYPVFDGEGGRSPLRLRTTTIGDELVMASESRSKVFAVSGKDRSAILPAGRLGKAFWYDPKAKGFTTSAYYYDERPHWVRQWNEEALQSVASAWRVSSSSRRSTGSDATNSLERPPRGMSKDFPHVLGAAGSASLLGNLRFSPFLDELTLRFAEALIVREKLGMDEHPDLLAISLSSTDYVGHAFGPDSREAEENLARLNGELEKFLSALDRRLGPREYLVILTADHGADAIPEYKAQLGLPAYRVDPLRMVQDVNERLRVHFDVGADLIEAFAMPFIYLDLEALGAGALDREEVARVAARMLQEQPGVARAIAIDSDELERRDPLTAMVRRGVYGERSGDICVIQEPSTYLLNDAELYGATHGSPYAYDRHVPLMAYGMHLDARTIAKRVAPTAIAPTLAIYLRIPAPPFSRGDVLGAVTGAMR